MSTDFFTVKSNIVPNLGKKIVNDIQVKPFRWSIEYTKTLHNVTSIM